MKHPEVYCDCPSSAGPLTLRWRCPDCGKTAIMRVTMSAISAHWTERAD